MGNSPPLAQTFIGRAEDAEKRETRNEKRETRNEKRETRNEKIEENSTPKSTVQTHIETVKKLSFFVAAPHQWKGPSRLAPRLRVRRRFKGTQHIKVWGSGGR
jgi:hypothetical protein